MSGGDILGELSKEMQEKQLQRLELANIMLTDAQKEHYLEQPDDLGEFFEGMDIPDGFKRCGKCKHVLKFYLFNVNNSAKNKCTGNCKACQKISAAASYERTKGNRDYKTYYREHKELKQAHGKKHYEKNKEKILEKQKAYHNTKQGKKVMRKSHKKRRELMARNRGVTYKREWVIDRDKLGGEFPICYICGEAIKFEREIQIDHLMGIAIGGKDCFTNVACTHELCNLRKKKDCSETTVEQVELIIERAEKYIDEHPELFID